MAAKKGWKCRKCAAYTTWSEWDCSKCGSPFQVHSSWRQSRASATEGNAQGPVQGSDVKKEMLRLKEEIKE
eukprot:10200115-Karenia_brevis.AAC.1